MQKEKQENRKTVFMKKVKIKPQKPRKHDVFPSKEAIWHYLARLQMKQKRNYKSCSCPKDQLKVRCKAEGCPFLLDYRRKSSKDPFVLVNTPESHTCEKLPPSQIKIPHAGSFVASEFGPIINLESPFPKHKIHALETHDVRVTAKQLANIEARNSDRTLFYGECGYSFLPAFLSLAAMNGSYLAVEKDPDDKSLKRLFFAPNYMKELLGKLRKVIAFDGATFKNKQNGIIFTASSTDFNNHNMAFCVGIFESENFSNWSWFLFHMKEAFKRVEWSEFSLISDYQKGLVKSVAKELPQCQYQRCGAHFCRNFIGSNKGVELRNLFWMAATSVCKEDFDGVLKLIRAQGKSTKMLDVNASNSTFSLCSMRKCNEGQLTSNIAESCKYHTLQFPVSLSLLFCFRQ